MPTPPPECSCPPSWPRNLPVMLPHGLVAYRPVHVVSCDMRDTWRTAENASGMYEFDPVRGQLYALGRG